MPRSARSLAVMVAIASATATLLAACGGGHTKASWAAVVRPYLGCLPPTKQKWDVVQPTVTQADVTGDGVADYLIEASCPTTTSTNPLTLVIFDGRGSVTSPKHLATLGNESGNDFRTLQATNQGAMLVLSGQAISSGAPMCCPDTMLTITYKWTGQAFSIVSRTATPTSS